MKKNLIISGIILGISLAIGGLLFIKEKPQIAHADFSGYTYQRTLTVANASSTQTSFPVLICFNSIQGNGNACTTAADLKATSSGGSIMTATGLDIIFSTSTDASSILPFEREFYSSTTGSSIFWVNMPTVANGQIIYMYYGKAADTDHSSATTVWDTNFKAVWHLPNGTTLTANDSTSNGNNGTTVTAVTATSTQVDGGGVFNGTSSVINRSVLSGITDNLTMSAWIYPTAFNCSGGRCVIIENGQDNANGYGLFLASDQTVRLDIAFVAGLTAGTVATSTWSQIALTRTSGTWRIYINGAQSGSTINNNPNGPGTAYSLGAGNDGSPRFFFTGNLDEGRFSTTPRASSWIATEYNSQSNNATFWTVSGASTGAITPNVGQISVQDSIQIKIQGDTQLKIIGQ